MECSESEAFFDSANLNPQLFINTALNIVDELIEGAFDHLHKEASTQLKIDGSDKLRFGPFLCNTLSVHLKMTSCGEGETPGVVAFMNLALEQEGRIDENGHLQCSYHGWSFDGCGSCSRIPQASSVGPEARAVQSPRACVTRFPTMVSQGLLFVWLDENGLERANATMPSMLPDDFDKPEFSTVTIQRD